MSLQKKLVAEALGTCWLVLGGCGTAILAGEKVGFHGISVAFGNTRGVLRFSVLIDPSGTVRAAEAGDFDDLSALEAFVARSNAR